jgi:hypothetical protein
MVWHIAFFVACDLSEAEKSSDKRNLVNWLLQSTDFPFSSPYFPSSFSQLRFRWGRTNPILNPSCYRCPLILPLSLSLSLLRLRPPPPTTNLPTYDCSTERCTQFSIATWQNAKLDQTSQTFRNVPYIRKNLRHGTIDSRS